jgi:RimJ/RimL family protein N-acetyltransferase
LAFIRALAEYERLADQVEADEETHPCRAVRAESEGVLHLGKWAGEPAASPCGSTIFRLFSPGTESGGGSVCAPELRGKGVGKALMKVLAQRCAAEGLGRFEWPVLAWNEPSIRFYRSLGAVRMEEWQTFRLSGPELARLAAEPA